MLLIERYQYENEKANHGIGENIFNTYIERPIYEDLLKIDQKRTKKPMKMD